MTRPQQTCVFLLFLLLASGCSKPDKLYFIPIGNTSTLDMDGLVNHYREKFGIEARVLERINPRPSDLDAARQQYIAENLIESMRQSHPEYSQDKKVVIIGITADDIYMQNENFAWVFSCRDSSDHAAVVSTARMDLHYPGEPSEEAMSYKRLQKVITKDIGIMFYRKGQSSNPRSVLYNNIGGIDDLDRMSEDF